MPVTRVGLSTYGPTWSLGSGADPFGAGPPLMNLPDLVELAIECGVDVVQFADNRPLDGVPEPQRRILLDRLREAGIGVEIAVRGVDPEHLRHHLAVAVDAGSALLRTVLGTPGVRPITADEAIAALAPLRAAFEDADVVLALENYDFLPVSELARISRTLGSWTGICLDTVNSFGALEGPREVIDALADRTVNLHVKDFEVVRAAHTMGFSIEGRAAGEGRLDVPRLFDRLDDRPDLTAVIELWTPPQATLHDTRVLELDWVRRSAAYLREHVR